MNVSTAGRTRLVPVGPGLIQIVAPAQQSHGHWLCAQSERMRKNGVSMPFSIAESVDRT
jgi:hypothetical protein